MIKFRVPSVSTLDGRSLEVSAFSEKKEISAEERAFLAGSSKVFSAALESLEGVLGRKFAMPRLGILGTQREGNFGVVDFSSGRPAILLNPNEHISIGEAGHELTHYMRFIVHGKAHKGTMMILEEACAILVEASLPCADKAVSHPRSILGFLSESKKSPDPFDAAGWIVGRFASKMRLKETALNFVEAEEEAQIGMYVLEQSLKNAESRVDVFQWEDHRYAPVRHKIGAGVALLVFMINQFDPDKSLRYAVGKNVSEIMRDISYAIRNNDSKIIGEIRKLKASE